MIWVFCIHILSMKQIKHIILDIEKLPEGYCLATSKDVQGLVAQNKNKIKTKIN